jgi:Type I phosphodiesterase / nucleotide pyrophosphatase
MARPPTRLLAGVALPLCLAIAGWSSVNNRAAASATYVSHPSGGASEILRDSDGASFASLKTATPAKTPTPVRPPTPPTPILKPSYLVLIVLDGARPGYFTQPGIPHIQALRDNGTWYANAMAGILESETPSGHATISTGSEPKQDGIPSFSWANANNTTVNLFSEAAVRQGLMERVIAASGAPTIASLVHKTTPAAKVVALSGYKFYAADALGGPRADVVMYYGNRADGRFGPTAIPGHMPPKALLNEPDLIVPSRNMAFPNENHLAMTLAARTFDTLHQQVTLINLPDSDWPLGHPWGANRDQKDVRVLMQAFDADLGRLEDTYRKAGVLDKTLFVITADHGFAPTFHRVPKSVISSAVQKAGTSILKDTYHTAAYLWIRNASKAAAIAATIAHKQNPYIQSVYFRSETAQGPTYTRATGSNLFLAPGMEAANQYLLQTFNGPSGPDIVVLFTENSAGVAGGQVTWKADHGGADWEAQHVPLILSGPGVRRKHFSQWPARLEDVAPTALSLLGVPPTGMYGTILADSLRAPTPDESNAQAQLAVTLRPVIASLQAESRLEAQR